MNSKEFQESNEQTYKLKSASSTYIPDWNYAVSYTSLHKAKFFGISHYGNGWGMDLPDYYVRMYKTNCGLCSWDFLWDGWIYESMPYWAVMDWRNIPDNQYPYTRLRIIVMPETDDPRPSDQNYLIAYSPETFYSHSCTIGSYDSRNCYVGTAPTGTTAFINRNHINGDVFFYYTPLPGNVCPVGLGFDGANCAYLKVPSNCEPFFLGNNWYVKPDRILN